MPIYNRLEVTKKGLESLYRALEYYKVNGKGVSQIFTIVIDDGSSDGSSEWISSNYRDIILLKGDGNLWWTGAINKGADYAIDILACDYLLLWNDDVQPCLDYFLTIEGIIYDDQYENTIIGSKILTVNPPDQVWSAGGFFNKFSGNFGMKRTISNETMDCISCDWQPGMGTLVPVRKIRSLGLKWDEKHFPHYHGDSDFTLRCRNNGMQIITNLDLILNNNTDSTGISRTHTLRDLRNSLTSLKSIYNIRVDLQFYSRHGIIPFVFLGMFWKYFMYIGGFIKHSLLRIKALKNFQLPEQSI